MPAATLQGEAWQVSDAQTAAVVYEESLGDDDGRRRVRAPSVPLDAIALGWVQLGAAGRARPSLAKPVAAKIAVRRAELLGRERRDRRDRLDGRGVGGDGVDATVGRHDRRRRLRAPGGQLMAGTQFTFASMIHRGFLADQNATTEVTVAVPGKEAITRQVPMMTPGDVIGIPSRQVIRCTPVNGLVDAEPNYLATIEFDAPDLPWMFSRKPASGPIQPWITLAVVDVTDLETDPLSASPVGTQLTIDAAQLPNPAEAWMWAHGQLLDTDTVPGDPARSLSRLVSSRKLEPNRRYLACVVPGVRGGQDRGARHRIRATRARAWISRGIRRAARSRCRSTTSGDSAPGRTATSSRSSGGCTACRCRRDSASGSCCSTTR